jgi:thiaminase (transcriptional activator TenA)
MADVISVTNSDSAFDASKGVTRTNLPPFAQRLRKAADLVWEEGYRQPFIRELGEGTLPREKFAFYLLQVIGNRFVLYRRSQRDDVEHIRLVRE